MKSRVATTMKEAAYDEEIFPLVQEITRAALRHGIAFAAHFDISGHAYPTLTCSTQIPDGDDKIPETLIEYFVSIDNVESVTRAGDHPSRRFGFDGRQELEDAVNLPAHTTRDKH